jgi:hypothetical protein
MVDQNKLQKDLSEILSRNNKILAVMRRVQEMEVPEGLTPLDLLAQELEKAGLTEGSK